MKKCSKCNEVKELTKFSNSKKAKDGKQYSCKLCANANIKKFRQNNPEYVKAKNKEHHMANPEYYKANNKKWRQNNPEKLKANNKKWKETLDAGVYAIKINDEIVYIGESNHMEQRFYQHRHGTNNPEGKYAQSKESYKSLYSYLSKHDYIIEELYFCPKDAHEIRRELEAKFIQYYKPRFNIDKNV